MKLKLYASLFIVSLLLNPYRINAASCCGGGASFPSLILSDDKTQLGLSASFAKVIGDVPYKGKAIFRAPSDDEWIHTYTLDATTLLSDRWQMGLNLPLVKKSRSTDTASSSEWGLGDVSATSAFEFLPEYSYSKWKPRGFLFMKVTFPTGGNIYESTKTYSVDSRGTGLYTLSFGSFLIKSWGLWDASFRFALNKPFDRSFETTTGTGTTIRSGIELNTALSAGFSPGLGDWRIGLSVNPFLVLPSRYSTIDQLKWTTTLDLSRILERHWVLALSYSDQTLLGPAKNTSLERAVAVSLRYKWER